ncbi:hypothetical protein VTI28DRAFT_3065 [Corynascus sepedonium]
MAAVARLASLWNHRFMSNSRGDPTWVDPGRVVVVLAMRTDASALLTVRKTGIVSTPECRRQNTKRMRLGKATRKWGLTHVVKEERIQRNRREYAASPETQFCAGFSQSKLRALHRGTVSNLGTGPKFSPKSCDSSILFPPHTSELPDSNHQTTPERSVLSLPVHPEICARALRPHPPPSQHHRSLHSTVPTAERKPSLSITDAPIHPPTQTHTHASTSSTLLPGRDQRRSTRGYRRRSSGRNITISALLA